MPRKDYEDALNALNALVGRDVLVLFRAGEEPIASMRGVLTEGMLQDRSEIIAEGWDRPEPESGPVMTFGVDKAVFALIEHRLVAATFAGKHVRLEYTEELTVTVRDVATLAGESPP